MTKKYLTSFSFCKKNSQNLTRKLENFWRNSSNEMETECKLRKILTCWACLRKFQVLRTDLRYRKKIWFLSKWSSLAVHPFSNWFTLWKNYNISKVVSWMCVLSKLYRFCYSDCVIKKKDLRRLFFKKVFRVEKNFNLMMQKMCENIELNF